MSELPTVPQAAWVRNVRISAGEATLEGNMHFPRVLRRQYWRGRCPRRRCPAQ
jgi:hypothetical protein